MKYNIFFFLFIFALNTFAQIECPEVDACFPPTHGHNLTVPSLQYPTLEAAILAAPPGSNIRIKAGQWGVRAVVDKQLTFIGNHTPGLPTVLFSQNSQEPIFSILGSPTVKFRKLSLWNSIGGIQTEFFHNGPWASVRLDNVSSFNLDRALSGSYERIELNRVEFIGGIRNAISVSRVQDLRLRGGVFKNYEGFGLLVVGTTGMQIEIIGGEFDNNEKGGIMVKGEGESVVLSKVRARNNGTAGIIIDHAGPTFIERSQLAFNRSVDGKFGNGVLVYSSKIQLLQNIFFSNNGFETAFVGCGIPVNEQIQSIVSRNIFVDSGEGIPMIAFALYPIEGCGSLPIGTISDGGGNTCNETASCKAEAAGGALMPISISL